MLYAIAHPSLRSLFVIQVDQSKTVELTIMKFSPHSNPTPPVIAA